MSLSWAASRSRLLSWGIEVIGMILRESPQQSDCYFAWPYVLALRNDTTVNHANHGEGLTVGKALVVGKMVFSVLAKQVEAPHR